MKKIPAIIKYLFLCIVFHASVANAEGLVKNQTLVFKSNNTLNHHLIPAPDTYRRTAHYPTQVIRLKIDLAEKNIKCAEFAEKVFQFFEEKWDIVHIKGGMRNLCSMSSDGKEYFVHFSYMYPYTEEDAQFIHAFNDELRSRIFSDIPFEIETVKGVLLSLRIDAATTDDVNGYPEVKDILYRMKNKLYFDDLFEIENHFINDHKQLLSNNPELITSYIRRWLPQQDIEPYSIADFLENFKKSDALQIWMKYTFIMEKEPRAIDTGDSMGLFSLCREYPSGKCLE